MPNVTGTTRAQTYFLRSFIHNPAGPAPADWPTPAILRRWLRRPTFRAALLSIRDSVRFQADFQLVGAATAAANSLAADDTGDPGSIHRTEQLISLLRLAHIRQRFNGDLPANRPALDDFLEFCHKQAPDSHLVRVLEAWDHHVRENYP